MKSIIPLLVLQLFVITTVFGCNPSITTASGPYAAWGPFCSGDLIFADEFHGFNDHLWRHETNLAGGHNGEFQWYVNNRTNTFVQNGHLHIRPTLTADVHGEDFVYWGHAVIDPCTDSGSSGCEKWGNGQQIINPIQSGKVTTLNSFHFKYGTVEVTARNPLGNWLWPAIWLLPKDWVYGGWPVSGEIDLMESRGNEHYYPWGGNIGVTQVGQTLHFGPYGWDSYEHTTFSKDDPNGFHNGFHKYKFTWTDSYIQYFVDDQVIGTVVPPPGGFWEIGGFTGNNPWYGAGHMAPFDQEFYIILNLAVGGTNGYFPEYHDKPWQNWSPTAAKDFWEGRWRWLDSWRLNENNAYSSSLIIDSVRVWAL